MESVWKVTTNVIDGKTVYGVYRIIDPDEPEHSGNRELLDYFESREAAQDCADAFNRGGVGAKVDAGSGYSGGIKDIDEPAEEPSGFDAPECLQLPIDSIDLNPLNPRKHFDEERLRELAQSIKEMGLLQPLVVTESNRPGRYLLIAGERRLRACKMIGLTYVPVTVYETDIFEAEDQISLMLIENLQREDLDPIEEANGFATLTRELGWKQVDLAEKIGVSQSHIANRIRLLNLPESAQEAISTGQLTASAGKELATLAKVPAVREIIEEAIADEDSAQNIVWQAKNAAYDATRPLHRQGYLKPLFRLKDCEGCKYRIILPERHSSNGKTLLFCMDVKCWDEKQEAAEKEAAERAKQQVLDTGGEIVNLTNLPSGSYEYLDDGYGIQFDQTECASCEHKAMGKHNWAHGDSDPREVCLNPGCFKAKKTATEKEIRRREKELKAAHDERKEQMIADFFPRELLDEDEFQQEGPDFNALVYIAAQAVDDPPYSSSMSKAKVKTAVYERYGWEKRDDSSWDEEAKHLVDQLAMLSVNELLRLIFFAMLKPIEYDDRIFKAVYGAENGNGGGEEEREE